MNDEWKPLKGSKWERFERALIKFEVYNEPNHPLNSEEEATYSPNGTTFDVWRFKDGSALRHWEVNDRYFYKKLDL